MSIFQASAFISYLLQAKGPHGIHSPFVFEFLHTVLDDSKSYYDFERIEMQRGLLLQDSSTIQVTDMGAGSKSGNSTSRSIRSIAKTALKRPKFCRALYRMAAKQQPRTVVELGTSLGISTAYLSLAHSGSQMHSIEGCPEISRRAGELLDSLNITNCALHVGNFDLKLGPLLESLTNVDLVFIDGNHRLEPTLRYFRQILPSCSEETVLVFDDIHWSKEMSDAWEAVKRTSGVTLTIDIFEMGFVFLKPTLEKQHFVVRY